MSQPIFTNPFSDTPPSWARPSTFLRHTANEVPPPAIRHSSAPLLADSRTNNKNNNNTNNPTSPPFLHDLSPPGEAATATPASNPSPLDDAAFEIARKALEVGHRMLNHWLPTVLAVAELRGNTQAQDGFWAMQQAVTDFALAMQIARCEIFGGAVAAEVREALGREAEGGSGEGGRE